MKSPIPTIVPAVLWPAGLLSTVAGLVALLTRGDGLLAVVGGLLIVGVADVAMRLAEIARQLRNPVSTGSTPAGRS